MKTLIEDFRKPDQNQVVGNILNKAHSISLHEISEGKTFGHMIGYSASHSAAPGSPFESAPVNPASRLQGERLPGSGDGHGLELQRDVHDPQVRAWEKTGGVRIAQCN